MPRREHVRAPRALNREPERMVDDSTLDLVVAGEAGEDWEACGVCGGPSGGPDSVRGGFRDRPGAGVPAATLWIEGIELVEPAGVAVDNECVPVAGGGAAALDLHVARDRIRAAVGLIGVVERDACLGLPSTDNGDRDPDRRSVPETGAEVGVQARTGADRGDDLRRVAGNRQLVDALVPRVRPRKDGAARRGRAA